MTPLTAAFSLPGTLDHAAAAQFVKGLPAAVSGHTPSGALVVDASALTSFDSSALAVLLECRRLATAAGQGFAVAHAPARLTQLATVYGVAELFPASA